MIDRDKLGDLVERPFLVVVDEKLGIVRSVVSGEVVGALTFSTADPYIAARRKLTALLAQEQSKP